MKTFLFYQDLIIIKTINERIARIYKEVDNTILRFVNGEINEENYMYIIDELVEQMRKYNDIINQIKGVK